MISLQNLYELENKYIINTYNRQQGKNLQLAKGEGCLVWDVDGKEYLDFVGGLAVNVLGHCHPAVVKAVREQAGLLMHTSNLYYTEPQIKLARMLVERSFQGKVFYANSGAEANEAAIKLARKFNAGRFRIITARKSFHGRTLATLTATGQSKFHKGFEPLVEGFSYAGFNDLESFERLMNEETAAIMIEPVQGEGGVHVAEEKFIRGLRELCDRSGALLIFDEVQCGLGRTGHFWAYENWGVYPDVLTVAKGLGGGLPIGVMLAGRKAAQTLQPGDHASTFGGNPVACRAALEVLQTITGSFLEGIRQKGFYWRQGLQRMSASYPGLIKEYRGLGLIWALELKKPLAAQIQRVCQEKGLLVNVIGDSVIRILPPLIVSMEQLEKGLDIMEITLNEVKDG